MSTKLYVGNLPFKVREEDLLPLFQQAGTVQAVNIIRDKFSGQSRGFGFVEMGSSDEAQKAIEMFNGHTLDQRQMIVNEARPQTPRPPRGPGGNRSGPGGGYNRRGRPGGSGRFGTGGGPYGSEQESSGG
ncbi:MAG TPA: RNA-binding protein [Candidatus Binatia bacterium]|nr:RNA-binding protein [Candidatus Binatia bacterium]